MRDVFPTMKCKFRSVNDPTKNRFRSAEPDISLFLWSSAASLDTNQLLTSGFLDISVPVYNIIRTDQFQDKLIQEWTSNFPMILFYSQNSFAKVFLYRLIWMRNKTQEPTQPLKSTAQPLKSLAQPLKSTAQPLKSFVQPFKSTAQPLKSLAQPFKSTTQPFKSTAQPLKSLAQPFKSTA